MFSAKKQYTINESSISSKHSMSFISITTPFTNPQHPLCLFIFYSPVPSQRVQLFDVYICCPYSLYNVEKFSGFYILNWMRNINFKSNNCLFVIMYKSSKVFNSNLKTVKEKLYQIFLTNPIYAPSFFPFRF